MSNFAILDNVQHKDLRVQIQHSEAFGDGVNQALVFPTEFMELQREYPIFFRKSPEGEYFAVVLLGLDRDENLFLTSDGWNARYVPDVLERGPFAISIRENDADSDAQPETLISVDLDHPRISQSEGETVFLPQGGHSPYLNNISQILQRIHVGASAAPAFFAELEALNLIEPISIEIKVSDTEQYTVPDVYTISKERMAALSGEQLEKLNSQGLLEHCFAIISSTGNVSRLIEMKAIKKAQIG